MNTASPVHYTQVFAPVSTWATYSLKLSQSNFNKNPNAFHFHMCLRAMLIHQQLGNAIRCASVDRDKLSFDLDSNPIGLWGDIICRATTGKDLCDMTVEVF